MFFSNTRKAAIVTTFGTALEWAEYTFFAYMADILSTHFFAIENPDLARLKTYGIFATSYFMRPLGAILFGSIGDKKGRKPALIYSMALMCFATTAIGFLPTYASIGSTATILLILCRLLQGIAVAGEFNGAAIYMVEHDQRRPFLAGSFAPFAATLGMACGALAATLVSVSGAPSWAWRIPFWISGFMGLVILFLRQTLKETPVFQNMTKYNKLLYNPLITVFKNDFLAFLITVVIALAITVNVYIGNVYYKTICVNVSNFKPIVASQIVTFGQLLAAILIIVFGLFADKFNGKKICLLGLALAVPLSPLIFAFGQSGDVTLAYIGQIFYAIINALISSTMMTFVLQNFRSETRYTGSSLGWNISVGLFGGTALMVSEVLVNQVGWSNGPGFYMSIAAFLAFCVTAVTFFHPMRFLKQNLSISR